MSRSYRKTKKFGWTCKESDKVDKQLANRKLRRLANEEITKNLDTDLKIKDVSNVYNFAKDGKQYYKEATKKDLRK